MSRRSGCTVYFIILKSCSSLDNNPQTVTFQIATNLFHKHAWKEPCGTNELNTLRGLGHSRTTGR